MLKKKDFDLFIYDLCVKKVRPSLDGIEEPIQQLLKKLWHHKPNKRPNFLTIIDEIYNCIADCALKEEDAISFWTSELKTKHEVSYTRFIKKLCAWLDAPKVESNSHLDKCLMTLCSHQNKKFKNVVSIDQFGLLAQWFGPLREENITILDKVQNLCKNEWFFGELTREETDDILKKSNNKSYLLRLSLPDPNKKKRYIFSSLYDIL